MTIDELTREVGKRIYKQRVRLDVTQTQLAEACSVSHSFVSQMERGEKTPSLETLVLLSKALRVPVAYFFAADVVSGEQMAFENQLQPIRDVVHRLKLTAPQIDKASRTVWALFADDASYKKGFSP